MYAICWYFQDMLEITTKSMTLEEGGFSSRFLFNFFGAKLCNLKLFWRQLKKHEMHSKKNIFNFFFVLFSIQNSEVSVWLHTSVFCFFFFHFGIFVEKRRKNFFWIKKVFLEKFRVHLLSSTSKAGGLSIKRSQGLVPKLKRWNTLAFWREGARVTFFFGE